ncbi:MAG TPA: hypothetical protein DIW43_11730 [Spongiibacteraceae bacterium]|nr:hypothetical protein [Spongiibacteraceae bacterium]HCS28117.1 hypothetical protein [Spongiibacteraceae bacterium]|tara:strand:+ start:1554 stop:1802 length:249 start_codon:yes stop_codon:yes gene_type:complete
MSTQGNVVHLKNFKEASRQAVLDDISAQAFMFLREEAQNNDVPMKAVLLEHLLGLALVIKAVEGADESARILHNIAEQINAQ